MLYFFSDPTSGSLGKAGSSRFELSSPSSTIHFDSGLDATIGQRILARSRVFPNGIGPSSWNTKICGSGWH